MNSSGIRKRLFSERNAYQKQATPCTNTEYYNEHQKYKIITEAQSQNGIRGQLILFESKFEPFYSGLQNSVDRINATLKVHKIEEFKENCKYRLEIDNEIFAEGDYVSLTKAKRGLAELATENLKKNCFTIFRKMHPRDSPKIDLASSDNSDFTHDTSKAKIQGIGARMMMNMGWLGGGLGVSEQGSTNLIEPFMQIQRQGLQEKSIVQEVTNILQNYVLSKDINSIAFSPDFSKEERGVIHVLARRLNLKSRSYGRDKDRIVVVHSRINAWDLIRFLIDIGGENDQFKLILPVNLH